MTEKARTVRILRGQGLSNGMITRFACRSACVNLADIVVPGPVTVRYTDGDFVLEP